MKKRLMVLVLVTTMLMAGVLSACSSKRIRQRHERHIKKLHRKKQCKKITHPKRKGRIK